MHCPQCGQEQTSGEMPFCKSCGFSLDGVRELLATVNTSLTLDKQSRKPGQSPRRQGVRQGVILLFISMVFMPLITLIGKGRGEFLPMIFLMAGLMRILYAVIFQEGAPRKKKQDNSHPYAVPITTDQLGTATRAALPRSQNVPASVFSARRMDTAERFSPPSVTEHTTKLLDKSEEPE
jgi:Na+/melibiose symporter-like transporter